MKKLAIGLLSAAALATTLLLVRQQKELEARDARLVRGGESTPATISLERIRELGL
jgi:glutamine amidotransferase PdxT